MEILRRSPMLSVLASLTAGLACWDKSASGLALFIGAIIFYLAVNFSSYDEHTPGTFPIFIIGLIIALIFSLRIYTVITQPQATNTTLQDMTGTVSSVRTWGRMYVAVIDTDNGKSYAVRMPFMEMLEGTRIRFSGITQAFRPQSGTFSEAKFWKARGVSGWLSIRDVHELPEKLSLPLIRTRLSRFLSIHTPNLTAQYLKAAWLGERNNELNKKHQSWGTSHLLAVSGFHVGIVILVTGYLFGSNTLFLTVILWGYILLTGAAPSAMRAGLMFQAGLTARLLGRKSDGVNCVSVAGVMLLLWRPFLFWDIGFRLSVLSALTITMMPRKKFAWLFISVIVFLVTFPQVAYTFKKAPAFGVIINTAAPAYFAIAFTAASCAAILRMIHVPFMKYILLASEGGFILWEKSAETGAQYIPAFIPYNYFTAWLGAGLFMFMLCRHFGFSSFRTLAISIAGSLAAFMLFL